MANACVARAIRAVIAQYVTSPQEGWLHQKAVFFFDGEAEAAGRVCEKLVYLVQDGPPTSHK